MRLQLVFQCIADKTMNLPHEVGYELRHTASDTTCHIHHILLMAYYCLMSYMKDNAMKMTMKRIISSWMK